ncbi:Ribosomal RNA small subunit methyltransferase D [Oligella urethralis]|uniref:RsmD family RNA methyltransferase n=1 Tax=Oligella urethralis TaxID=90245 RepID=UPI0029586210|nr:RsmD family RNA methyltransferase [Oligella urethralis]WOS38324.1 Ribosomal RNA small subunit methyltransferase D [Oligella urethralis]
MKKAANTRSMPQKIRIIGGTLKRSNLPVVSVEGLRPTPDRVRETLFNWLNYFWDGDFSDKSVFDLFAGSGALGFEAASRGAQHVQMVESHPKAVAALRQFRDKHQLHQVRINDHDARLVLKRMDHSRFHLILIDPPFADEELLQHSIAALPSICKNGTLVYLESATPVLLPADFELLRQDQAGASHFYLYHYISETAS